MAARRSLLRRFCPEHPPILLAQGAAAGPPRPLSQQRRPDVLLTSPTRPGSSRADGHGFGVAAADLDGDGRVDLYVANDQDPNFLFLNRGDGTFRDATDESGAGLNIEGRTSAGMGVDAEDLDGDGQPELFVTNFQEEYNTLYKNLEPAPSLMSPPSSALPSIAFPGSAGAVPGRFRRRRLARYRGRQWPHRR